MRFEATFDASAVILADGAASGVAGKRWVHIATHGWFAPETIRPRPFDAAS